MLILCGGGFNPLYFLFIYLCMHALIANSKLHGGVRSNQAFISAHSVGMIMARIMNRAEHDAGVPWQQTAAYCMHNRSG